MGKLQLFKKIFISEDHFPFLAHDFVYSSSDGTPYQGRHQVENKSLMEGLVYVKIWLLEDHFFIA